MSKVILLGVTVGLCKDWEKKVPGPKTGHLKDPAKIEAKIEEWREGAMATAIGSRLATNITEYVMVEDDKEILKGTDVTELFDTLVALADNPNEVTVFCFDARTRISQVAFEERKKGKKVPLWMWMKDVFTPKGLTIVDPIHNMILSSEDMDQFCIEAGITPHTGDDCLNTQIAKLKSLY